MQTIIKERSNLLQLLGEVQAELKAPKGQRNTYGGYNYRSCEDILEAVKPLLAQRGLIILISDEIVQVGERYYVRATATIYDTTGSHISNSALAREEQTRKGMDASQITGATSSYARKYALNGLLAIDDTKDADATNKGQDDAKSKAKAPTMTPTEALKTLQQEQTLEGLKTAFGKLPAELRSDDGILAYCKTRATAQANSQQS